jgi:hypothetical protein
MIYLMCSEAKAKAAILYNYRNVMSGFSARLTPPELEAVKSKLLYLFNLLLVYLIYTVRVDHTMHGRQASSSPNGVLSDYCLFCGCRATSGKPGAAKRDLVSDEQQVRRRQLIPLFF